MFPKLIDTGGFFLPTYGVLVAAAFLVAIWLTGRLAGSSKDRVKAVRLRGELSQGLVCRPRALEGGDLADLREDEQTADAEDPDACFHGGVQPKRARGSVHDVAAEQRADAQAEH